MGSAALQHKCLQDMLTSELPTQQMLCCGVCCCWWWEQAADARMRDMHDRLETQEQRQNTIVNFLARVAQNPTVLQQMVSVAQSAGLQRLSSQRGGAAAWLPRGGAAAGRQRSGDARLHAAGLCCCTSS
eukprot:GHRQ01037247.1.p1 GENE.GHRQ01037247.1~~GHRQ01037247.1.p1  ORF type:complete len:129 (-),score=43.42 GHRQ01037247.1:256-642(-)